MERKDLNKKLKELKEGQEIDGYVIKKHLADGHAGKVYEVEKNSENHVLKVMYPSVFPGRIMYSMFFQKEHGYFNQDAVDACFYRRRMMNRLMPSFDENIEITDALNKSEEVPGFYSEFVNTPVAETDDEKNYMKEKMGKLSKKFREVGLPTWAFDPELWFYSNKSQNFRLEGEKITIIDYESGVLTPSKNGWDLDYIDFDGVKKHYKDNEKNLIDSIGGEEHENFKEALVNCEEYTNKWKDSEKRSLQKLISEKEIEKTVDSLLDEEIITEEERNKINGNLTSPHTKYILGNLAVHLGIGMSVGVFTGPIPVGFFPRGAWTIGNRIYNEVKRNKEKCKVHNLGVLAWSSMPIPGFNYFGYLLPLKKENEDAANIMAEHFARTIKGKSLKEYLDSSNGLTKFAIKKSFIPKERREKYE